MRNLLVVFAFLIACSAAGQHMFLMGKDSSFRSSAVLLGLRAEGELRSTDLQNRFVDKLLFGGTIDESLKTDIHDRLNEANNMGGSLRGAISLKLMQDSLFKNPNWSWQMEVSTRTLAELTFSKDFFDLAFYGNSRFKGESADLSGTGLLVTTYQKIGAGIFHKKSLSGFTVSLVNGQSYQEYLIQTGSLYTSATGDLLELAYNTSSTVSDTALSGFGAGPGLGAAFDGVLNFEQGDNMLIQLRLHDLGFVSWNSSTLVGNEKDTLRFAGLDLQDVLNDQDFPTFSDSISLGSTGKTIRRWLPGSFDARMMRHIGRNGFYEIGFAVRPVLAYNPMLFGAYRHFFNPGTLVGISGTYGGYGGLRFGVSAEQKLGKGFFLSAGTSDVFGWASPKGFGRDIYLSITYAIFKP